MEKVEREVWNVSLDGRGWIPGGGGNANKSGVTVAVFDAYEAGQRTNYFV